MELVTAANNKQIFIAATESPADSIYLPLTGLVAIRFRQDFFSLSQLPELIDLAHRADKKVYPVINGHPHQKQLPAYQQAAKQIYDSAADGVVVGSPEIICWIKQSLNPKAHFIIIASSSARAVCRQDIDFLSQLGADRVIISRLHSLSEIRELAHQTSAQLELFVHGLICPCWEGQDCSMPLFTYADEEIQGCCLSPNEEGLSVACSKYHVEQDGTPLWAMRVQSDISLLPRIVECGVSSIKVIPPAGSIADWRRAINIWREALDGALSTEELVAGLFMEELESISPLPVDFDLRVP